jgi:anti-sigma factor RsiW
MTCVEAQPLLHAYLDGELDLTASLGIEQHLEACRECSAAYRKLELLRVEIADADLDFASDAVLQRLRASTEPKERRFAWRTPAFLAAAAAVLVVAFLLPGRRSTDREIVDSHLRSLLGDHLIDIPSSDRHTVKPWFQGKIDFAPPVPDLTAEGFVLVGGRLDVIDTRKVAALVYKRREHVINLWISQGDAGQGESEVGGYHVLRWSKDGLTWRAVSDLDVAELRTFATTIRNR